MLVVREVALFYRAALSAKLWRGEIVFAVGVVVILGGCLFRLSTDSVCEEDSLNAVLVEGTEYHPPPLLLATGAFNPGTVKHSVAVVNNSDRGVRVRVNRIACNCALVADSENPKEGLGYKDTVEVGARSRHEFTATVRVQPSPGLQQAVIGLEVESLGGERRTHEVRITIRKYAETTCTPSVLDAEFTMEKGSITRHIRIDQITRGKFPGKEEAPAISGANNMCRILSVRRIGTKSLEDDLRQDSWEATLCLLAPPLTSPVESESITVSWPSRPSGVVLIPVTCSLVSGLMVSPSELRLPLAKAGVSHVRRVTVWSADRKGFRILDAFTDSESVRISPSATAEAIKHCFEVEFYPSHSGIYSSTIRLRTSHPKQEAISFSLSAVVP